MTVLPDVLLQHEEGLRSKVSCWSRERSQTACCNVTTVQPLNRRSVSTLLCDCLLLKKVFSCYSENDGVFYAVNRPVRP